MIVCLEANADLLGRGVPSVPLLCLSNVYLSIDVTGTISLPEGQEMCMPGDNVEMGIELITPIAVEDGMRFAIREGGRTVGAGAVTSIDK